MTSQTFTAAPISLGDMFTTWLRDFRSTDVRETRVTPEETRARRDFISEMLETNPGALTSETDMQTMMLVYPCRF